MGNSNNKKKSNSIASGVTPSSGMIILLCYWR